MTITRIDDNTIRCILTQEDLKENNIDLDDILERKPNAMIYLRSILAQAAREENFRLENPFTSMQVRVLRDNSICLTLSQGLTPCILRELKETADRLRSAVENDGRSAESDGNTAEGDGITLEDGGRAAASDSPDEISGVPACADQGREQSEEAGAADAGETLVGCVFDSVSDAAAACRSVPGIEEITSDLYRVRDDGPYYLFLHSEGDTAAFERSLLALNEFGSSVELHPLTAAYVREHGKCILKGNAADLLRRL